MLIGDLEIWWLSVNPWRLLVCTCGLRELEQLVGYYFSPRTPWDIRLQLRQNRKFQQPRSRCSSKQKEMSTQLWPAISEAILCFSYVIFRHVNLGLEITCNYQACIASINMRESPSRNYIEKQGTYFLITLFLSYLCSTLIKSVSGYSYVVTDSRRRRSHHLLTPWFCPSLRFLLPSFPPSSRLFSFWPPS